MRIVSLIRIVVLVRIYNVTRLLLILTNISANFRGASENLDRKEITRILLFFAFAPVFGHVILTKEQQPVCYLL